MAFENAIDAIQTGIQTVSSAGAWTGSTVTQYGTVLGGASNAVSSLGVATNGQLVIGSTAATPVLGNITSSDSSITITNGAGTIVLSNPRTAYYAYTITTASDATYYIAQSNSSDTLEGTFYLNWAGTNRADSIMVSCSIDKFDTSGQLSVIYHHFYNGFGAVMGTPYLVYDTITSVVYLAVDISNRNSGTGPIYVTWVGSQGVNPAPSSPSSPANATQTGMTVSTAGLTTFTGGATIGTTAYAVLCGGTTAAGAIQSVSGVGTTGQVLTSNGAGTLPTWQAGASVLTITTITSASSPYTVLSTDEFIAVNTTGGVVSVLLPNTTTTGRIIRIKDSNGNSFVNAITLTTVGGAVTIDGSTSYSISINYKSISVIFDGTSYEVF